MVRRNRNFLALAVAALVLASYGGDRRADLTLALHRADDPAPLRMEAAIDLGLIAVSLLVTWSRRLVA